MNSTIRRLGALGTDYQDPLAAIDWSAADPALPWLPPSHLSLAGHEAQARLTRESLVRFSQVELARLCAAGLWLEGLFISRVASRGFLNFRAEEARVMLQEVREESGHSLMFLEMIERAGLTDVALLGPTALLSWVAHRLRPGYPEFWAMVFIGETVTDTFAVGALKASAREGAPICPVARQVLAFHHREEARHIAAARVLLEGGVARMTPARRRLFAWTVRFLLGRFLRATLYPTPASLDAAGLDEPQALAAAAHACPRRRRLARACAAPALEFLARSALAAGQAPGGA